jgi:hypothetical protein
MADSAPVTAALKGRDPFPAAAQEEVVVGPW